MAIWDGPKWPRQPSETSDVTWAQTSTHTSLKWPTAILKFDLKEHEYKVQYACDAHVMEN